MQIQSGATRKTNNTCCDGDFQFHHFWKEKTYLLEKVFLSCWIQALLSKREPSWPVIKYNIKLLQTGLQKENQIDCFQPVMFFS